MTRPPRLVPLAALAAALCAGGARAQTGPAFAPCVVIADSARADTGRADVRIVASVSIDELRFESKPRASVQAPGCGAASAVRVLERRNLPERVEPGVTYRDVQVSVEILGSVEAACIAALAADAGLAPVCAAATGDGGRAPQRP